MVYHSGLTVKELSLFNTTSFELTALKDVSSSPLLLLLVYRPPKPAVSFLSELNELLTIISSLCFAIIVLGDFNIHVNTKCPFTSIQFNSLLECFNLIPHVDFLTHIHVHILDLLCSTGFE